MTIIKPFKGICYNLDKVFDLSNVVCLPYDVINQDEQNFCYQQSPYNFIRLDLNREEPGDNNSNNRYARASKFFNEWLKTDILKQDTGSSIYFYKQDFLVDDKELSRVGFIGLLELSDSGIVFPHEKTHAAPKTDRFELMKNVSANFSPIFTVFSDKDKIIKNIFNNLSKKKSDFVFKDAQGIRNVVWRLSDSEKIREICEKMKNKQIFIADGHHRYEVASMYRKLMQKEDKNYSADKSYNYVMTYFTALESEGLYIMPVHRIIKSEIDLDCLKNVIKITKLKSMVDLEDRLESFSGKKRVFGLYYRNEALFLELKDKKQVDSYFRDKKCFKNLDVAILDFYILSELLKIQKDDIMYTKDATEAKDFIDNKIGLAAFILRPTTIKQIKEVSLCGEKMPPKSTYFYPKLISGVVIYKFSEDISLTQR
jgi:uncharacterized protein (DUF1015 family)